MSEQNNLKSKLDMSCEYSWRKLHTEAASKGYRPTEWDAFKWAWDYGQDEITALKKQLLDFQDRYNAALEENAKLREAFDVAKDSLEYSRKACLCRRGTKGFDYSQTHKYLGMAEGRWKTPRDQIDWAITQIQSILEGKEPVK